MISAEAEMILPYLAAMSEEDRAAIATFLLHTLPPPPGALCENDPGFLEEIYRRLDDIESGKTKCIPAEVVMARLRDKYGSNRTLRSNS